MRYSEGLYPGRFQPFLIKHLNIVQDILRNYSLGELIILVADWRGKPTKENFLNGEAAKTIARYTIEYAKLEGRVRIETILLNPEIPFQKSLRLFFQKDRPDVIFSGSSNTIKHCTELISEFGFKVVDLHDDDETPPRAREVRDAIANGREGWESLVVPMAAKFLKQVSIQERLRSLGEGNKRPWSTPERK